LGLNGLSGPSDDEDEEASKAAAGDEPKNGADATAETAEEPDADADGDGEEGDEDEPPAEPAKRSGIQALPRSKSLLSSVPRVRSRWWTRSMTPG
jgi:hypothetical protein